MSEAIPARAFYEAYGTAMLYPVAPWDDLADDYRAALEVGVQAAIAAARVPSVAINLSFDGEVTEERAEEIRKALADAIEPGQFRDRLAAAMAARDEYRDNAILHIRERDEAREQLAAADRATAEFRRQCSELAGELGAARAVVRDIRTHLADAGLEVDEELQDAWWDGAGIGAGQ